MKKIKLLAIVAIMLAVGMFFGTNDNLVKADVAKEIVIEDGHWYFPDFLF